MDKFIFYVKDAFGCVKRYAYADILQGERKKFQLECEGYHLDKTVCGFGTYEFHYSE